MNWKRLSYSLSIAIVITAVAYVLADVGGRVLLIPGVIAGLLVQGAMMIAARERMDGDFIFAWRTSAALLVNAAFYTGLSYGVLSLVQSLKQRRNVAAEIASTENASGPQTRRRGVSNLVRFLVSFFAAFLLAGASLFDVFSNMQGRVPSFLGKFLFLPGYLYCEYLKATEPLPADDVALFQLGQGAQCFFVGITLNLPYYTALIFGGWWLVDKWRSR
jgi:hypothetical protein